MTQTRRKDVSTQKVAATKARSFRSFLLMAEIEAREIGERIAQARLEAGGMTQDDLAALATFSKRSLQDYEGGVTIPYKHLRELGRLLSRSPEWFLYGEESEEAGLHRLEAQLGEVLSVVQELKAALLASTAAPSALHGEPARDA